MKHDFQAILFGLEDMPFSWWEDVKDDQKEAIYDSVRVALLIGVAIRGGLLLTGLSLLVVEGNFLLDWAMTLGLAQRFGVDDIGEVTIGALIVLGLFLVFGIAWRYRVLQRISHLQSMVDGNRREEESGA